MSSGRDTPPKSVVWYREKIVELWTRGYLTRREAVILSLMAVGFSAADIGKILRLSQEKISGSLGAARRRLKSGMTVREQMKEMGWKSRFDLWQQKTA